MKKSEFYIFETIKKFDKRIGVPDYHNLADKMLPIFTHAFLMVFPEATGQDEMTMYRSFNLFLQATQSTVRYGLPCEEVVKYIYKDVDVFEKAIEYIKSKASKTDIVLYLD